LSHRMIEEIYQQPEMLQRILDEDWANVCTTARALRSRNFRFAMLAARGTSDNAAHYAKYLFEVLLGVPTALASPSAFTLYESDMHLKEVLVVGISQSGESKDVLETVGRARELGASTIAITNDEASSLAGTAEFHLSLHAGKEESIAATKTYTAELMLLYLLVNALGGRESLSDPVWRLPEQAQKVLEVRWIGTARYRYVEHLAVVSRGYNLATAKEAALKLMEAAYVVAEAFSGADLRHGPMAMIGQDFPVVTIVPPGKARPGMEALIESLSERGAELVVIGEDEGTVGKAARFLMPESCPEDLSPVLYALPIQMLAYELARLKGLDPDAPRGLNKVTETW
jgi:glucosamine--fructose-6-phosphate aminotransferase (isomerizing)